MIKRIALAQLHDSPFNPRGGLGDLSELTASIRSVGLLQPPLAREVGEGNYQLVFGHRRKAAAAEAGLSEIVVDVRDLDDREVLLAQLAENSQRQDVSAVLEAHHFRRLHEEHEVAVEDLAAKVGKSKAYVYGRLKLCDLSPKATKAALAGDVSTAVALMIARIPKGLQDQALQEATKRSYGDCPLSTVEVRTMILEKYTLRLAEADFDIVDAELVPKAGACSVCPRRTGAQPELFADVDSPDICVDPVCFKSKRNAGWIQRSTEARAKGLRVLSAKETKKVLPEYGPLKGHIDLDSEAYAVDPQHRTWRRLLGSKAVKDDIVLARDESGEVHELLDDKLAKTLLKEKRPELMRTRSASPLSNMERKEREEAKTHRHAAEAALGQVVAAVETDGALDVAALADYWRLVAGAMLENSWGDTARDVAKRRGLEVPKRQRAQAVLKAELATMSAGQLAALQLEFACTHNLYASWAQDKDATLKAACELLGVDWDQLERDAKKPTSSKKKATSSKKKPTSSKKKPTSSKKKATSSKKKATSSKKKQTVLIA